MSRFIRDDLHMRAYRRSERRLLTRALKEIRLTRAGRLLQWYAENGHENIIFTDEKIFTIEEQYDSQNDKICAQISCEAKKKVPKVQRGHHPSYVMVLSGCSIRGDISSFCDKGVKTGARVYQEDVLQGGVKPLNTTLFNG